MGTKLEVYNEPQADGTVIQYDNSGRQIKRFASDVDCKNTMDITEGQVIRQVGIEFLEAASASFRTGVRRILEVFGVESHAA